MQPRLLRKPIAVLCALSLHVLQPPAHAGDLNTEVTNMFNNLGAVGNYTDPGAFKGQTFNTFTGGNLYLRSPNKTYQLAAIQFPSARAGCGGIDVFGGSFSHISAEEFKNMLRNIPAALPGIAFQLALEAFQARHGIQIVPISVDGGGLPTFTQYRRDNGISRTLQVTQVPAVFLAEPFTGKITPIGFGVLSESQLIERIATVTAPGADALVPSVTRQVSLK